MNGNNELGHRILRKKNTVRARPENFSNWAQLAKAFKNISEPTRDEFLECCPELDCTEFEVDFLCHTLKIFALDVS